jgi:putative nucleotidyltransferase with HDIG domain
VSQRQDILLQVRELPALPTGAGPLIAMLQSPDVDIARLIERIEYDPGITSNLLRLANSSYFAGPRSIGSIREAVVRLGTRRLLHLVVASAVAPMARRPVLGYDLPSGKLLEHSIAAAVAAERLGVALNGRASDYLFTAGLLHDLGKIVLGTYVRVDAQPITDRACGQGISFDVAERLVLGVDHAEVGAELLTRWELPPAVVQAVRWHHQPEDAPEAGSADLVHAADALILSSGIGSGEDGLNYRVSNAVAARLGVTSRIEEQVLSETLDALEELRPLLMVSGGN